MKLILDAEELASAIEMYVRKEVLDYRYRGTNNFVVEPQIGSITELTVEITEETIVAEKV